MKAATRKLFVVYLFLLLMALSFPSIAYWLPVLFLTFLLSFSFLSAYFAKNTLMADQSINVLNVSKGDIIDIQIGISAKSILPIAPIQVCIKDLNGNEQMVEVKSKTDYAVYPFEARHVGHYSPGVEYCIVSDIFGLFEYTVHMPMQLGGVNVLPRVLHSDDIAFGVGDMGALTIRRAQEDLSSPDGVRKYQMGDPLKKMHWKLSLRKQELMVRQYEEPTLPSSLILMDVAPPHVSQQASSETLANLKDCILETAASIAVHQCRLKNKVKLPIMGSHPFIYTSAMEPDILLEQLSHVAFDETEIFERFLFYEMGNIKQAGAVLVITSRLSSNLVEVLTQIASRGPVVHVYLVSYNAQNPAYEPMIHKLENRKVKVSYCIPEQTENENYSI